MHILFLSQLVPYPADAGPKVRSLHVIEYLASAGHDITLVAFSRPTDSQAAIEHLSGFCKSVHTVPMHRSRIKDVGFFVKSFLNGDPFLIARDHVPEMHNLLKKLVSESVFDAVHADQLWMAPYALAAGRSSKNKLKLVLDQHNAVYLVPERMAGNSSNRLKRAVLGLEGRKLAKYEVETCANFDEVVWVTDDDRLALKQVANGRAAQITGPTIPICVDPTKKVSVKRNPAGKRVTFLGGLHWPPNAEGIVWFYKEVWPQILLEVPDATLTIIGKNPPTELEDGAAQGGLEVTGYVDDPLPYLEDTAVFVVPLHSGGGMRVKIIDGWSWGLPIVSTTIGAEGIQYKDGTDICIADTAADFARISIQLLQNPNRANSLSVEGRNTVETHFSWQVTYKAWDNIYG